MSKKLDQKAIPVTRQYLEFRGYTLRDPPPDAADPGYDLIATRGSEILKIRLKSSARPWDIPDLDATAVNAERHLVADFLYVVYFDGRKEPKLCIIPREAIKPEFVVPKQGYRINAKLKKESFLKPFLHAV